MRWRLLTVKGENRNLHSVGFFKPFSSTGITGSVSGFYNGFKTKIAFTKCYIEALCAASSTPPGLELCDTSMKQSLELSNGSEFVPRLLPQSLPNTKNGSTVKLRLKWLRLLGLIQLDKEF